MGFDLIFGVAIAACFLVTENNISLRSIAIFVVANTVFEQLSFFIAMIPVLLILVKEHGSTAGISFVAAGAFFVGGTLRAALVLAATVYCFGSHKLTAAACRRISMFCPAGGIFVLFGSTLPVLKGWNLAPVIWQAGIGLLMSIVLWCEEGAAPVLTSKIEHGRF